MTKEKPTLLIYFSFILLLISVLNFSEGDDNMLLITRVIPIILSIIFSFFTIVSFKLKYPRTASQSINQAVFSPLFIFYLIFIVINSLSGSINGEAVGWLLWKNTELLAGLIWFVSFFVACSYYYKGKLLNNIFAIIFLYFLIIGAFTLFKFIEIYSILDLIFFIRPEMELPKINPLLLSVFAVYILIYSRLKLNYSKNKIIFYSTLFFGFLLLLISKSRTGVIIILLYFLYETIFVYKRFMIYFAIIPLFLLLFWAFFPGLISNFLLIMRLEGSEQLYSGSGRFSSGGNGFENSSWGESILLIEKNPLFGIGNINTKRFIFSKDYSVDNFFLQTFIAGGVIGASLLSIWAFIIFPFKFWKYFSNNRHKYKTNIIFQMSNLLLSIFFVRCLTTNGAAFFGFEFLFLAISFTIYKIDKKYE